MDKETLMAEAKKASQGAYAPYSRFKVGAALLADSGKVYTGCNVENISFGATICAERTAAVKAVSEGERRFTAVAVYADTEDYLYPCGICRQFLAEFAAPDMKVYAMNNKGGYEERTFKEVLPHGFERF
jgi:cytidine deaminase